MPSKTAAKPDLHIVGPDIESTLALYSDGLGAAT